MQRDRRTGASRASAQRFVLPRPIVAVVLPSDLYTTSSVAKTKGPGPPKPSPVRCVASGSTRWGRASLRLMPGALHSARERVGRCWHGFSRRAAL